MGLSVRPARPEDEAAVAAFTAETWPDRRDDYLPRVFADWVAGDGEDQRTLVADDDGTAVGLVQGILLSADEAWMQGMRVAPDYRGRGLSSRLHAALADWARERGATVGRCLVFSWNGPALAAARVVGFDPAAECRWVHPRPEPGAEPGLPVAADPEAGWACWRASPARDHLAGLALAQEEPWTLRELTPATLAWAADETWLGVVGEGDPRGLALRVRDGEHETDAGDVERWAEYGVAAWADEDACVAVLTAVARDAGRLGADRARVLVPETVGAVSDAALAGAGVADEPLFVLAVDLAREG